MLRKKSGAFTLSPHTSEPHSVIYIVSHSALLFLAENQLIPTELRREALALQGSLEFDDAGGEGNLCSAALFHTEPTSVPTGLQVLFSHTGQFPT